MSSKNVAVVGATGAVGRAMLSILSERDYPVAELRLMASARSAGQKVETVWGEIEIEDLALADPGGIDIALFSAGGVRSREFAPKFAEAGAVVIDNSSAFRMVDDVPLVVAGINDHAAARHNGIIANPNCTTMTMLMGVAPLHRAAGLKRLVASSYQAVSGSGKTGVDELSRQTRRFQADEAALNDGTWVDPGGDVYSRPIAFNVLPLIGDADPHGYTDEEMKLLNETRKILEAPGIEAESTCVRVPVVTGHGTSVALWFERPVSPEEAVDLINAAPGAQVWLDRVPTPLDAAGIDDVIVGRIRPTLDGTGGLNIWTVGDNLRKGAALNAVQIAELLI
ncbi:MAG: aspartate-semialdehyde dehydrogenase [Acidimicrobiia bacterium]|nr:aspartate-semialdehyde dehydrogenase [Acidimicrobiia bacterium]